ncbi:hypothetical protein ASJ81_18710 [Methanosarcina spelaei]|uniref:Uncharacterized protein n=1 Tax=Methanosarcina spelaei TaxID=1036679 RepID=A0A2A2HV02_9EURY|nr:hypothetical protein ASJ81_18710 [Methanosarcina spelaei]
MQYLRIVIFDQLVFRVNIPEIYNTLYYFTSKTGSSAVLQLQFSICVYQELKKLIVNRNLIFLENKIRKPTLILEL